ncbi:MAG: ribonuclease domain-containing protein [Nocardioidaceae bacterium]
MLNSRWGRWVGLVVLVAAVLLLWRAWHDPLDESEKGSAPSNSSTATSTPGSARTPETSGLKHVAAADLPAEAQQMLRTIDAGGPFEFRQDGAVFQNREGHLPAEPRGFYKEYTVVTPGSDDRGARRIVVGRDGSFYYTDDHYDTFREVDR